MRFTPHLRPISRLTLLVAGFAALSGAVAAIDLPKRKPGLWEIHSSLANLGGAGTMMQNCIDEKTDDLMARQGEANARQQCSRSNIRRDGNRVTVDMVCKIQGGTATTRGAFSGDFESAYRGELVTDYNPPVQGMKQSVVTLDARYVGPCQPGQKPGDIVLPGMGAMTPDEIMKRLPEMMKNMPNLEGLMKNIPAR